MKKAIVCVMSALLVQLSLALTEIVDGTEWTYHIENGDAILGDLRTYKIYDPETGVQVGILTNNYTAVKRDFEGKVVIPDLLDGHKVVNVGAIAFSGCTNMTEVVFGNYITNVSESAFANCHSLTNVCFNNKLVSIKALAFYADAKLRTINFPSSLRSLDRSAFRIYLNHWGIYDSHYEYGGGMLVKVSFSGDQPTITDDKTYTVKRQINNSIYYDYYVSYQAFAVGYSSETSWCTYNGQTYYHPEVYIGAGYENWDRIGENWENGELKIGAVRPLQKVDGESVDLLKVIASGDNVTISCPNYYTKCGKNDSDEYVDIPPSTIYYTIDGSEPTTDSMVYSSPIPITKRTTIKAIAVVSSYPYTITETCSYAFGQTAVPSATMEVGNTFYLSGSEVTLACETEGAEIRYTLDGREPTKESLLYTGPFPIDDTTMVRAKAFKEDWFDSETATTTFTREWYTVATPVIEPDGGEIVNTTQEVSISCETDGATIYYTLDGSVPSRENGFEYRHPFNVSKSCTIRAVAIKNDWKDSEVSESVLTRNESLSEAANLFGYTMETDGDAAWIVDDVVSRDGISSVKSGAIGNNEATYIQTSVKKAGSVSFWWRAMCEENDGEEPEEYYDYGAFLVDGAVVARIAGHDGEWRKVGYDITTGGKHTLRWEYRKDGATSYAPDCIWVDCVQWVPADDSGVTLTTPVEIPYTWLKKYELGEATDFETAGNSLSGKTQGGKATSVWQEYVMGTDPTNEVSQFKAEIKFEDGVPKVEWDPDLNAGGEELRVYKVFGKENLFDEDWTYPTNSLHRFFKVTVEMP